MRGFVVLLLILGLIGLMLHISEQDNSGILAFGVGILLLLLVYWTTPSSGRGER